MRLFKGRTVTFTCKWYCILAVLEEPANGRAEPRAKKITTEVLYGTENAVSRGAQFMERAKERMDLCYGKEAPSIVIEVDTYRKGYRGVQSRGGRIRVITEITKENIGYCRQLAGIVDELRHMDGVRGGLAVSEGEYMATIAEFREGKPLTQVIYSNSPVLVDQQQYIFDSLWKSAVPAEDKFAEIERGIEVQSTRTISSPQEAQERIFDTIRSAEEQLLILISDLEMIDQQMTLNLEHTLSKVSAKGKKKEIKVLLPAYGQKKEDEGEEGGENDAPQSPMFRALSSIPGVNLRIMREELDQSLIIVVADKKRVVFGALGAKRSAGNGGGSREMGIYSSNKAIASTYSMIINTLWNHIELYGKLQELDELKEEFVNIAAHELRTPVLPIILSAEVLAEEAGGVADEKIAMILRNASRLNRLTNQILDISRLDSNTLQLRKENVDIVAVVQEAAGNRQMFGRDSNPDVEVVVKSHLKEKKALALAIDKERVMEVLFNLLDNAFKFTKKGTITVSLTEEEGGGEGGGFVRIDVSDTGTGIDSSIAGRLFTKFASKSAVELKGTGLGLYLCKKLVEAHGGRIWARNNENGVGATFSFTLPIAAADATAAAG